MKFVCPSCNIQLQAEADLAGKAVKCPGCGTKIQIPESAAPPPPDVAPPESGDVEDVEDAEDAAESTAEEMVGQHYDDVPELEMSGSAGPHPAHVNAWIAGGAAVGLTFVWYLIMFMLPERADPSLPHTPGSYLRALFTERSWPQYVTTFMMFWCLSLLILKSINIRKQRRAMLIQALPDDIADEITPQNLILFHSHVVNFPGPLRNTFIVNRIRKALEFFYVRQNNPDVAQMISSQSEIDANKVLGSYSLVKVFLWAIPIMGFIGTVLGIGTAIGGFEEVLNVDAGGGTDALTGALTPVLGAMGVAFDTTLLALVFSILLSFPASALQNSEEDLVIDVDEYCIDNLLKRLNDGGAAGNFGSDAGLLKAVGDAMANNQKDMLGKFADTQKTMASNLENQTKNYEKVAVAVEQQLEAIAKRAESYEQRLDEDFFENLDKIRTGSITAITDQVKPLSEGIHNLNAVLKELNGKQVVVQKKGWFFGRG